MTRGDVDGRTVGRRIVLPSSFTGGPRYMYKHYQDALAIYRVYGNPQYFITFTCNSQWPEILHYVQRFPALQPQDRADAVCRVFHMKVKYLVKFLQESKPFGQVAAYLYTIEFQKRGLPHCHLLLWVTDAFKIKDASEIDKYINAEIPDVNAEPVLHKIVTDRMMHGPCSLMNPKAPCMRDNVFSKGFLKQFQPATFFDKNGYVFYKRRCNGVDVVMNGYPLDNCYVIPYSRALCLHFRAHINVEHCGWSMLIKYLFKYISKGADRIRYAIVSNSESSTSASSDSFQKVDEIQNYVDGRFICPHEAAWRILNFPIQARNLAVQVLAVHLENMQPVRFEDHTSLHALTSNPLFGRTTLTAWMRYNTSFQDGLHLTYADFTKEFRWDIPGKCWLCRLNRKSSTIGRLVYIHPSCRELFYLRLLLCNQHGCKSFADLRTVSGITHSTFRSACEALGLIGNDQEWDATLVEAASWASSSELWSLFAHMLLFCDVANPRELWNKHWTKFSDDIVHKLKSLQLHSDGVISDDIMQGQILADIQHVLNSHTTPRTLREFDLPVPDPASFSLFGNRLLLEESSYDRNILATELQKMLPLLNEQERVVYESVKRANDARTQLLAFVHGHGGTGKTFLWKAITAYIRSIGEIVLTVAASRIAALLLPSGRTAHSRFKIPIELTNQDLCKIRKHTHLAELLEKTSLIIWDEAPMSDRKCFECLDRTLRDIKDRDDCLLDGMSVLLGGDFRQTLPIIPKGTRSEIMDATLPRPYLWFYFKFFTLKENIRLLQSVASSTPAQEVAEFSKWLLRVGDGDEGISDVANPFNTKLIEIPAKFPLTSPNNNLQCLINFVYNDSILQNPNAEALSSRAIVCPKKEIADEINQQVLEQSPGNATSCLSIDSMVPHIKNDDDADALYPAEYLNQLHTSNLPPHKLELKIGTAIILLRNINQPCGLCNGIRLLITKILP